MTNRNHWLVNFETMDFLHHGIRNKLWGMGYQYARRGDDTPGRKGAISRNWKRLEKISPGDKFVAYAPGNRYFAIGTVKPPTRKATARDRIDSISEYLKRGSSYTRGYIYFEPTVAYENFTDLYTNMPVRIDVESWEHFSPSGVSVDWPPG